MPAFLGAAHEYVCVCVCEGDGVKVGGARLLVEMSTANSLNGTKT